MNILAINRLIDHTLLKPDASREQIEKLCQEAKKHHFYSVCVLPNRVQLAREQLGGTSIKLCSVLGFPLGAQLNEVKAFEARKLADLGVHEIDMVMDIGALKDGNDLQVQEDIEAVLKAAPQCLIKVILETGLLSPAEISRACEIAIRAGALFIKTSTGFVEKGAQVSDIERIRQTIGPLVKIKASGGIRDLESAEAMLTAGADRLGCSQSVKIFEDWKLKYPERLS
jgi:deoxyribose-phosphate aldolase